LPGLWPGTGTILASEQPLADGFGRLKPLLIRQGSAGAALRLVSMLSGFASAILLARILGAEGLGVYASALALLTICSLPLEFGLPTLVTREVAKYSRSGDTALIAGLMRFAFWFTLCVFIPLAALAWGLISLSPWQAQLVTADYWWWSLTYIYLIGFGSVASGFLAGGHAVVRAQLPSLLVSPLLFLLLVGGSYFYTPERLTPLFVLLIQTLCTLVSAICCLLMVAHKYRHLLRGVKAGFKVQSWISSAWRLGLVNGVRRSQPQILLYILSLLAPLEAAGLFRIAQRGASLVAFGTSVVTTTAMPYISSLLADASSSRLQQLVNRATQAMAAWALVCFLGILFLGELLLTVVFGPEFRAAYWLLVACCFVELARSVYGLSFVALNMAGHERESLKWMWVSLAVSVLGAVALTPGLGGLGCALAYTLGSIVGFGGANRQVHKWLNVHIGPAALMNAK